MGDRSNYKRIERDSYDTPYNAVIPLLQHLSENTAFIEPCAGKNVLTDHLIQNGHKCLQASDIYPRHENIATQCVFERPIHPEGLIITNPRWDRKILHPLIEKSFKNGGLLGYCSMPTGVTQNNQYHSCHTSLK